MRPSTLAYHILLVALVPAAIWSFQKIDKASFYSHFFRVIEEVESRNSHALDGDTRWMMYGATVSPQSDWVPSLKFLFLQLLSWLSLGFLIYASLHLSLHFRYAYADVVVLPSHRRSYRITPIRAP